MRDARAQGRQIGRARRDRDLARRSTYRGSRSIPVDGIFETSLRIAGAIVLDALAFVVWNVGTRPPLQLIQDIRASFRRGRSFLAGILSGIVGFIFIMAATVLLVPAIPDPARDLTIAELVTFVVALAVEVLVGDEVRRVAGIGRKP